MTRSLRKTNPAEHSNCSVVSAERLARLPATYLEKPSLNTDRQASIFAAHEAGLKKISETQRTKSQRASRIRKFAGNQPKTCMPRQMSQLKTRLHSRELPNGPRPRYLVAAMPPYVR